MLLGLAIATLTARPLDAAVGRLVLDPLGNPAIPFGPVPAAQAAPTEYCAWRGRRIRGEVHDENAWAMGGVAGHAGLFGTAAAVASLGQAWLADCQGANRLLPQWLAAEATGLQAEDGVVRRGLGWAAWSPDPDSASHPLSRRTFGHTGFTGTSLYVDPERELVIACLTNEVYKGRQARQIGRLRVALHERVVEAL
jgi:CubicO group peptidase (beta-lactamase class C family)